jgi:hypothetical protein
MGGYGALRLGAKYAAKFFRDLGAFRYYRASGYVSFLHEPIQDYLSCAPEEELSALDWLRRHRNLLPPMRFDCGLQDDLLGSNRKLHHALK